MAILDSSQIVSLASEWYILRMMHVATITVLTYDYLLTIGREKELIWPSRLSVVKILFLLNRYILFGAISGDLYLILSLDPSARGCITAFRICSAFTTAEYYFAELVLYTRAYAIWGRTRTALLMIIAVNLVLVPPGFYLISITLKATTSVNLPLFPTGCIINMNRQPVIPAMVTVIVSEAIALIAVLVRAAKMPQSMVMKQISNSGVFFSAIILCMTMANIIVLSAASPPISDLLLTPQAAVHSICCNRLILQIKGVPTQTQHSHVITTSAPQVHLRSYVNHSDDIEMQPM
ncbi:uncharacterized protein FOMMEDRAFT_23728 [Fomitiporia mediterranea MF3/22]|uniref:uncharacterized protein n=1 Tax=Fomitiporia mediterranea (strain MF3/22) TaxID=694068 RepID=UPI000440739C|nr:uncharacterized protein FOMMEDRAFT_23728 [Fomitiporia mediterranea MF3/22]EJC98497.1 hypothetical protein FOMMEDRAFT_23728 [Fomitiporia mediterranea MF3/22]